MAANCTERFILLTDSNMNNFLEVEKNQNMKRKPKVILKNFHFFYWQSLLFLSVRPYSVYIINN